MTNFISINSSRWEYETFGSGNEILLAFHGFGNSRSDFKIFESSLGKKYKIISFDLPYHGKSSIDKSVVNKTISKNELKELFEEFLNRQQIKKFSVMGYSLGGKIALQLIEFFPKQINGAFLFAPDGIRNNWSNGFVTKSKIGKKIYKRIIDDPSRFFKLVKTLKSINIINPKISDFLHHSLATQEKRKQVWDVWVYFRDILPNIKKIQDIINENNISVHLFFGKYDTIIPPSIGKGFISQLKNKNALHIVDMGHVMIREKMNAYLLKILD